MYIYSVRQIDKQNLIDRYRVGEIKSWGERPELAARRTCSSGENQSPCPVYNGRGSNPLCGRNQRLTPSFHLRTYQACFLGVTTYMKCRAGKDTTLA